MEKFRKHKFDCTLSPLRGGLNEEAWVVTGLALVSLKFYLQLLK